MSARSERLFDGRRRLLVGELGPSLVTRLRDGGYRSMKDVAAASWFDLANLPGIGARKLQEINAALARYGGRGHPS